MWLQAGAAPHPQPRQTPRRGLLRARGRGSDVGPRHSAEPGAWRPATAERGEECHLCPEVLKARVLTPEKANPPPFPQDNWKQPFRLMWVWGCRYSLSSPPAPVLPAARQRGPRFTSRTLTSHPAPGNGERAQEEEECGDPGRASACAAHSPCDLGPVSAPRPPPARASVSSSPQWGPGGSAPPTSHR